jgi:hypothetical protein
MIQGGELYCITLALVKRCVAGRLGALQQSGPSRGLGAVDEERGKAASARTCIILLDMLNLMI